MAPLTAPKSRSPDIGLAAPPTCGWTLRPHPAIVARSLRWAAALLVLFLIGFGVPVILTVAIYIIDVLKSFKLRPNVGRDGCFLSAMGARYFFNIPILIFLEFNTIIFVITTYSLWNSFKANEIATSQQSAVRAKVFNLKLLHQLVKTISLLSDVYVRRLCA